MIGKIRIGKSFRGCLDYCLENKPEQINNGEVKNRAEILDFNYCFGDKKELIKQFNDIRNLNRNLSKPVMHITLSFSPGERIPEPKLYDMIYECAEQMGFEKNLYVAIAHDDTLHQHIHIVVNRVGLDGKTLSDSHSYRKIAAYCRKMEIKHGLKKVLSPRKFLLPEQRQIPRYDTRKENLRREIVCSLLTAKSYSEFERSIRNKGYGIIKARGIAFLDSEKVKVKGSEVGYSLHRIEQLLAAHPKMRIGSIKHIEEKHFKEHSEYFKELAAKQSSNEVHADPGFKKEERQLEQQLASLSIKHSNILDILLQAERQQESINSNFLPKKKSLKQ